MESEKTRKNAKKQINKEKLERAAAISGYIGIIFSMLALALILGISV